MSNGRGSMLGALRRTGLLNPMAVASLTSATAFFGPSLAAGYGATTFRYPNRIAIVDDYGSLTYRQLDRRAALAAAGLKQHGLERGATIGVLCRNHRGFVEAVLAAAKLGVRPVLCNTGLPPGQLAEVIEREGIVAVIADRDLVGRLPEGITAFAADPETDEDNTFPDLTARRPLLTTPGPLDTPTPVILTSGTTGAPKGTRRSTDPRAAVGALGVLEAIPYNQGDVMVVPAPLFHAWGFSHLPLAATLAGTVVLRHRFDPVGVLADLESHGAEVLVAVPVMLHRILDWAATSDDADDPHRDLDNLRVVATSGAALPGDLAIRWMDRFGDNLHNLYGSTEGGQVSVATPDDLRSAPGTAGRPLRGVDLRILDADDQEVGTDEVGEIMVGGAGRFDGYTDGGGKRMVGDLQSTGDRGRIDRDGRLFVLGRDDDMIISGGENLFPSNIEAALLTHPAVMATAVVGIDDRDLGQKVRAVVVTTGDDRVTDGPGASQMTRKLKAHLKTLLAPHELPREFVYTTGLPRNQAGKILRSRLTGSRRSVPFGYDQPADDSAAENYHHHPSDQKAHA
ncbi:MAG: AMP-binding protein [Actinomycetota bacterium]